MRDTLYFSKLRVFLAGWRWRLQRFRPSQWRRWQRTHHTTCSPRPASLFALEPLESRVLLAADLTGVVQGTTQIDPAVPTNAASAVVQVQNIGNQRANAATQVAVYASLDAALGVGDVLLGTANTPGLNAGQSRNVTVNLTVPSSLAPGSYSLLTQVDNGNVITENSEANNVSARSTPFAVAWQFGNVPGRSGNTALTLTDADGTNVTFGLTGPGLGEVIRDGANWDVKVTGTTASSALTITTNNGGNDRATLNDVHVFGPLASFTAASTDLTGTLSIDGAVNIPGLLPGTITLGSIQGGTVAVASVEAFTVLGSVTNARFFIGTVLGADGQLGGTGANADSYGQGRLGLLTITGNMTGTTVRVGVNPTDGIYGNGNDQLVGGAASAIGGIIIGGSLSADSSFIAGSFPARYLAGSLSPRLTAGDSHFTTDPNAGVPSVTAVLQQDTGSSTTDGLTNNPAITGSVTDPQGIATFTAGFGATPTVNVLADRQPNGSFTFSQARLEQINGGPLADGPLTLTLRATDTSGNATQTALSFRLDRSAPATLTFDLAPASDSTPVGDQQTTQSLVTLAGQTEANALVELVGLGLSTTANGAGAFSFSSVALVPGTNSFTVRAMDTAGNQRTETRTITRLAAANQAPVAVNDAFTMTAGGSLSGVPLLVKDLVTGPGSSTPLNLVDVNGTLFFTADTAGVGRELWKSDGTAAGTVLVKDIVGGSGSSSPQVLTNVNGTLFFFADNGVTGVELWKSDGTEAGTVLVKDINPGSGSTLLSSFTPTVAAVNNTLFFTAFDPINGVELWKSDGTEAGTVLVKDIRPGANPNNSFPDLLTVANGTLFFVANDGVSGPELWKSDGTAAGTVLVQNVNPAGGLHITELEAVNGIVFFTANNGSGLELWKSDGTVGGAVQVANLNGALGANPRALTNLNGTLYFIATDSASGTELWKTDGTAAGTVLVSDMTPGSGSSNATFLTAVGGKLFFRNVLPGGDFELWVSDGTAVGTRSLGGPIPDTANGTPFITDVNGVAYFRAGGTGNDLWRSDGTIAGTVPVGLGTVPRDLVKVGNALYFSGVSGGVGRELMTLDGTANVLANDSDPEGSALTAILVSGPSNGTLTLNPNGTFNYTPNSGFTGTDTFTYKANDGSLDSNVATVTITVTAAPVLNQVPTLNALGNQTVDEGQALTFTATASDPDAGQTLTFSLANGSSGLVPPGATINPATGVFSWTPTEAQGPGTFTFDVVVTDNGNPNLSDHKTITVTVNEVNQAPTLEPIAAQTVTAGQLLSLTAVGSDNDVPANTLSYSLQGTVPAGATINPLTGEFTWTPTVGQVGPQSLTVRVTDNGTPTLFAEQVVSVTVEAIPNQAPVLNAIGNRTISEHLPFTFTATANDPDAGQTLTFSLANGTSGLVPAGATINPTTGAFSWTPTEAQGPGTFTFDVVVTDNGSPALSDRETLTVTVNEANQAPTLEPIAAQTVTAGQLLSLTAVGSDNDVPANTLSYSLQGTVPAGATINPLTGEFTWTPTVGQVGPHSLTVRVTDNGTPTLFAEQVVSVTVEAIPNQAPVLNAIGNRTLNEGQPLTFTATATDPNAGQTLTFSLANGTSGQVPAGATINPTTGSFSWTPTEAQGPGAFTFDVVVTDNGSPTFTDRETITVTVNEVNQAPVLTAIGNRTVDEGQLLSFTATATDSDLPANTLTYSLQGTVLAGATINPTTGEFTWIPTAAQIGPQSVTVRATDNGTPALFAEETFTVTVGEVNEAPVLNPIGNQTVDEGQALTFTATATEPDAGQTLTYSLANGTSGQVPAGATINPTTGLFNWTTTEVQGPGTFTFDVVVTDNGSPTLSDRETITVTVNEVNQAPTLEPITAQTVTAGQLLSFTAVGSDPDAPTNTLTYSLQGTIPAGASINPTTGEFTWTPTVGQVGPQSVIVRVTDNGTPTLFAEQVVSVTVEAIPNQAPVLNAIGNRTISEHLPFTFTATATDPGAGQTLTFSLANGTSGLVPAGATINPTTGAFSWTPTEAQGPGTFTFDVVVTDNGSPTLSDRETLTITVTEANAAPVLLRSSVPVGQVDSPLTPVGPVGTLVSAIADLVPPIGGADSVSDSDAGAVTGIAIFSQGTLPLWYSLNNGTTWELVSASFSNVRLLAADASTRLFVSPPSIDFAGSRVNEFQFQAWDRTVGTNGGVITTGTFTGPTGAFSSGFAQATVIFIEDQVTNQAPVLNAIGNRTLNEGQPLTFTATATDPNAGQTLTFSLANGTSGLVPAGATINPTTGAFSWTPTEVQGPGTFTFDVVVTDNGSPALSDRETLTVTVNEANQAPTLAPLAAQTVTAGQLLSFTAVGGDNDVPANTLTYSLQGTVPAGATINPLTGEFTWTPTVGQVGPQSLTVRVTDNGTPTLFAEQVVAITVGSANQAPTAVDDAFTVQEGSSLVVGTALVKDLVPGISSQNITNMTNVNGRLFFSIDNGSSSTDLWTSDGTAAGTVLVKDGFVGTGTSGFFGQLVDVSGTLFFKATDSVNGTELWKSDGTSAGTQLVKDVLPGTGDGVSRSGGFNSAANVNGTLYFVGIDATTGFELWKSDGTAGGTVLVKDIVVGGSSRPSELTNVNGTLFFVAQDNVAGSELFRSDGTAAGTVVVRDINVGGFGSNPRLLTNVNGTLFFVANDGVNGNELWKSDGTAAGTVLVTDITTASTGGPSQLTSVGNRLFFTVDDGVHSSELWTSDGTAAGTVMVKDIVIGGGSSAPSNLINVNGTLFFSANDGVNGRELWKSDGTVAGTVLVKDIIPGAGGSIGIVNYWQAASNGELFFTPSDGVTGTELWKSDGTEAGTVLVKNIAPVGSSSPAQLTNVNGTVFFTADDNLHGRELWKTGGSETVLANDSDPEGNPLTAILVSRPSNGTLTLNADGTFNYTPNSGFTGIDSFTYKANDGSLDSNVATVTITVTAAPVLNQAPALNAIGNQSIDEGQLLSFTATATDPDAGQTVTFSLENGVSGAIPAGATINPTTGAFSWTPTEVQGPGTFTFDVVVTDNGSPALSDRETITVTVNEANQAPTLEPIAAQTVTAGQLLSFTAVGSDNDVPANTLSYSLQGTVPAGATINPLTGEFTWTPTVGQVGPQSVTVRVTDNGTPALFVEQVVTITVSSANQAPVAVNDAFTMTAGGALSGIPYLVKDINPGTGNSQPTNLVNVNGTLFFTALAPGLGVELWKSDGTAAGTVLVKDVFPGTSTSNAQVLTNVNGTLFFFADNGVTGVELWKSDGTATGTVLVKDINPGSGSTLQPSFNHSIGVVNNTLFFTAFDPINGVELWKSDGTDAGTVLVKDIRPGASPNNSFPGLLTVANGTLFFVANDGVSGPELWKSDGTVAGTQLIANINPAGAFHITEIEAVNGTVFFNAVSSGDGSELWKSDGTAAGTVKVANIGTGSIGSSPSNLTNVNGTLYFTATAAATGTELWKTDGTAAGTVLVSDMTSGTESSTATFLTAVGSTLFFKNVLPSGDFELWVSDGTAVGTRSLGVLITDTATGTPFITDVNGVAYFRAGGTGNDLWRSDGSIAGTVPVGLGTAPRDLVKVGDALYFSGVSGGVGRELMKLDGTANVLANDSDPEGSALTAILVSGPSNGSVTLNTDGTFSYTPNSGFTGTDTFTYKANDGSLDSNVATVTITVTAAPVTNEAPTLNPIGNQTVDEGQALTFTATASDPDAGQTLTFSLANGTSGLVPAGATINPTTGVFSWTPTEAQGPGTFTFDVVVTDNGNPNLSDLETVTVTVGEVNQAPALNAIGNQTVNEGAVLTFTATATDGDLPANTLTYSLEGTVPAGAAINSTTGEFTWTPTSGQIGSQSVTVRATDNGSPALFDEETIAVAVNSVKVAPTAVNDAYSVQQDSTLTAGTLMIKDIMAGAGSPIATYFIDVNGTLFFTANDGVNGAELWKSDGTAAGTVLVKDILAVNNGSGPSLLTNVNGTLFFSANDGVNGEELWKSDGTAAGTVLVKDIKTEGGLGSSPAWLTNVNGTLFFIAEAPVSGRELWKSDGTAAGTVLVKDITPGDGSATGAAWLTNVNGTLFFSANDGVNGQELWKSDGTAAGTVLVKDIRAGNLGSGPQVLTNMNGTLFFTADDGVNGRELWKSDGTAAGTVLVKDVFVGINTSTPQAMTNVNGTLFFAATDSEHGQELWKSEGTAAGTVLVKDILAGSLGSGPSLLTNVNGTLFFSANDGVNGQELWKSDGTAAGTVLVKDIRAGSFGSGPSGLTNVNGTLFFSANDGVNGQELWKSDGTAAGTVRVKDIRAGSAGSIPSGLTNINGTLFFSANDGVNGQELWASGLQNNLLANDNDLDSSTLTATLGTGPSNGSLVLNADGTFTYRPNAGFTGTDTFTYSVSDGTTTSNLATVTITVA